MEWAVRWKKWNRDLQEGSVNEGSRGREGEKKLYASYESARCVVWWCGAAFTALAQVVNTR